MEMLSRAVFFSSTLRKMLSPVPASYLPPQRLMTLSGDPAAACVRPSLLLLLYILLGEKKIGGRGEVNALSVSN